MPLDRFIVSLQWDRTVCLALPHGPALTCVFDATPPQQLDSQMHKMMLEKKRRNEQILADQAAIDKLNKTIKEHVQPNMVHWDCMHDAQCTVWHSLNCWECAGGVVCVRRTGLKRK